MTDERFQEIVDNVVVGQRRSRARLLLLATVTAVSVLAVVLTAFAVLAFDARSKSRTIDRVEARAALTDEVSQCRSRLTAAADDEGAEYLIAIGLLVEAIAANVDLGSTLNDLATTRDSYRDAVRLRVTWELDTPPPVDCPA